jgi:hypothetical protein
VVDVRDDREVADAYLLHERRWYWRMSLSPVAFLDTA